MADSAITAADFDSKEAYKQSSLPRAQKGVFAASDQLYHTLEVNMSVSGGLTYGATNETNKIMTITLYGAFESGVDPGDEAAFPIDITGFTVAATASDYTTTTDKFPFYLIRCKFAADPDGENVTVKTCSWDNN